MENVECFIEVPQNHYPFQIINKITPSIQDVEMIYDDSWNKVAHFDFGNPRLEENDSLILIISADITMIRFSFLDLDKLIG